MGGPSTRYEIAFTRRRTALQAPKSSKAVIFNVLTSICGLHSSRPVDGVEVFRCQWAVRRSRLGLAELAAEVVKASGDRGQSWQAFQSVFVSHCLKFFA